ncbi:cytolytic toxin-alpha-like [Clarias gariepinus]|uniref:cytolytic toxin-alpha-like n=1 Tax=Clarias gariepinus TaxID=13013 RepID=UPI00234D83B9|nr:cytolytic toxin-alpha-like [Clarias gariepinus]
MDSKCMNLAALGRPLYPGMLCDCRTDSFIPVMDSICMKLAALGRPLYPGMLYDCRTDSFIPGVTLWDKKALHDDLDVRDNTKTFVKFAASDTLSEKANLLDASASLKASFLGGLVEVEGSAKFLHDTKSSARQCRVTMQYSQTTKFEQLTIKEFGNITYPQVLDQKTATHVVTAVLYGAQAFMVFDYTSKENQCKQAVEGNLHAVVKKIPTLSLKGETSLEMTEEEKVLAENMSVMYYGDFKLNKNPTTYMEALEVYKTLPNLMEKGKNDGVPLTVWLYPLTLLDDKAAKLVKEISFSLVEKTEKLLDELEEVDRQCNDLNQNQTIDKFPDVKVRVEKFQHLHSNYKIAFQNALAKVLPSIRSGEKEDKALGDILNFHLRSPFTANNMNRWLDDITTELNILSFYTSGLKDLTVVKSPGSLNSILFHPDVDVVVCLSFTSLKYEDSYLVAIEDFLNSEEFTSFEKTSVKDLFFQAQPWFTSPDIAEKMRQDLSLFTSFLKANTKDKRMKFIIGSISDPSNPGTSIRLYQKGSLTDPKFQPVSKPPPPVVETSNEKVLLKLSKTPTGKMVQFRVEYKMTQSIDSAADANEWSVTDTSDAQTSFTLTQIKEAGRYCVQYRAVSDVGVSEASDSVAFTFQETPEKLSPGIIRSKIFSLHSDDPQPVPSTRKSYLGSIPGGLRPGMALFFQGIVTSNCDSFAIDFQIDLKNIAFHFNPRMQPKSVVLNSHREGKWHNEEKHECPFVKGGAFDIIVGIKQECYEVIVNGLEFCTFKHRMPVDKVTSVGVREDVCMNIVHIIKVEDGKLKVTDPDRI